ncbi:MAG: sialidase family protein [Candidatus Hodarchaeota archaeon]
MDGSFYVDNPILDFDGYIIAEHKISKNKGESFSLNTDINPGSENATFTVTTEGLPRRVTLPVIRFDQNDRLYVLWAERFEDGGTWDVYLRYSDDYSLTWSPRYQVNPETGGDQWQPDMDIDSKGCLHVVYYDQQESSFRPYYRTVVVPETTDAEPIFGDPIPVATVYTYRTFTRPGDYFTVRVDSNDIPHVVWTDGRHNEMDIYYSHGIPKEISTSFGIAWLLIPLVLVLLGLGYNYRKKRLKV